MKTYMWTAFGALLGGLIGGSHLLCPAGGCPLTSTWYGGAIIGGLVAWILVSAAGVPTPEPAKVRAENPPR